MKIIKNTLMQIVLVFIFVFFVLPANDVQAGKDDNVHGYAWSENIGWISFNHCTYNTETKVQTCPTTGVDYGVKVDLKTKAVTGYAWSENIGWISFTPSTWGGTCSPSGASCANFVNKFGTGGYARAINGIGATGDYDGWISLGNTSLKYGVNYTLAYKDMNSVGGEAWGSNVIGWIKMSPQWGGVVIVGAPKDNQNDFEINVANTNIVSGDTVDIVWTAKNDFKPIKCTADGGGSTSPYPDSNWKAIKDSTVSGTTGTYKGIHVPPNTITTFKLSCTDASNVTLSDTIQVNATFTAGLGVPTACVKEENLKTNPSQYPEFTWTSNDITPSCYITARPEPYSDSSTAYRIPANPINPLDPPNYLDTTYKVTDTKFKKSTQYTITCLNGTSPYNVSESPSTKELKMCSSDKIDYDVYIEPENIKTDPYGVKVSYVPNSDPAEFLASTTLKIKSVSTNPFTSDADVKVKSGTNITGTFKPISDVFRSIFGNYNSIPVELHLTAPEYQALVSDPNFNPNIGILQKINLEVTGVSQNTATKSRSLNFYADTQNPPCEKTNTCKCGPDPLPACPKKKPKPHYIPF